MTAARKRHGSGGHVRTQSGRARRSAGALAPRARRRARESTRMPTLCWNTSASPARQHDLAHNLPYGDQRRPRKSRRAARPTAPQVACARRAGSRHECDRNRDAEGCCSSASAPDGTTLLLIEQRREASSWGLCGPRGRSSTTAKKIAEGVAGGRGRRDASVIEAYLGGAIAINNRSGGRPACLTPPPTVTAGAALLSVARGCESRLRRDQRGQGKSISASNGGPRMG